MPVSHAWTVKMYPSHYIPWTNRLAFFSHIQVYAECGALKYLIAGIRQTMFLFPIVAYSCFERFLFFAYKWLKRAPMIQNSNYTGKSFIPVLCVYHELNAFSVL
jgi:hypothetical protein